VARKPKAIKEVVVQGPNPDKFLTHPAPMARGRIIGHERPLRILDEAIDSSRVHHAWIFHGPKGVGKFTTALTFASLLLDPTTQKTFGGEFEADPSSQTQQLLAAGTHPDLFIIVKELAKFHSEQRVRDLKLTSIPADVVRDFLVKPATLASSVRTGSAAHKVFIVDDADLMNLHAQNALLKILEEPPPGVVIILVTSAEQELLPTIRSRSQRVYFSPLSQQQMSAWRQTQAASQETAPLLDESEEDPMTPEEERFLFELAAGAPGVFEAAHESGLHAWWRQVGPMLVAAEKGQYTPEMGSSMADLVSKWAEAFVDEHDNASKEAANKDAAAWMFRLVGQYIQRRIREVARLPQSAAQLRVFLTMLEKIREAEMETDSNVNASFVFEKLSGELSLAAAKD
jgi:DNA polymerase-3 subunit delta'